MANPCSNFDVTIHPLRVAGRVETATRTALGISLSGIVFPRTPGHNKNGQTSGAKKPHKARVAVLPACRSFDAP